jgi:hypothetical protein
MLPEAAKFIDDWQAAQKARLEIGIEEDSYVYLHLNADDDQPHHVGVGHTIGRPWGMKRRNSKHKNKVEKHGVRVEIISEDLTDAQAKWWEVRWIKVLREAGYELTNLTDGGDGLTSEVAFRINGTAEARRKNSEGVRRAKKNAPDRWFNIFSPEQAFEIGVRLGTKKQVAEFFGISTSTLSKIRAHFDALLGVPPQRIKGNKGKRPTEDVILRRKASFKKTWAKRTKEQKEDFSEKVSKGRMAAPSHWSNRLTETDLWNIGTLLLSTKELSSKYGITKSQVGYIRNKIEKLIGAPPRRKHIPGRKVGLALVSEERRTEIALKIWETRRRNKLLNQGVE